MQHHYIQGVFEMLYQLILYAGQPHSLHRSVKLILQVPTRQTHKKIPAPKLYKGWFGEAVFKYW